MGGTSSSNPLAFLEPVIKPIGQGLQSIFPTPDVPSVSPIPTPETPAGERQTVAQRIRAQRARRAGARRSGRAGTILTDPQERVTILGETTATARTLVGE